MYHSSTKRRVILNSQPWDARLYYCKLVITHWFMANYPSSQWDTTQMAHLADMIEMRNCPGDVKCAKAIRWILVNRPEYYGLQMT